MICLAGDGSLQMNVQELQTMAYHWLPIKLFVLNTGCAGSSSGPPAINEQAVLGHIGQKLRPQPGEHEDAEAAEDGEQAVGEHLLFAVALVEAEADDGVGHAHRHKGGSKRLAALRMSEGRRASGAARRPAAAAPQAARDESACATPTMKPVLNGTDYSLTLWGFRKIPKRNFKVGPLFLDGRLTILVLNC